MAGYIVFLMPFVMYGVGFLCGWILRSKQSKVEILRLRGHLTKLEAALSRLRELSCIEDITKETGRDWVCSMRINETTFRKASDPHEVIDHIFYSLKERFHGMLKQLCSRKQGKE